MQFGMDAVPRKILEQPRSWKRFGLVSFLDLHDPHVRSQFQQSDRGPHRVGRFVTAVPANYCSAGGIWKTTITTGYEYRRSRPVQEIAKQANCRPREVTPVGIPSGYNQIGQRRVPDELPRDVAGYLGIIPAEVLLAKFSLESRPEILLFLVERLDDVVHHEHTAEAVKGDICLDRRDMNAAQVRFAGTRQGKCGFEPRFQGLVVLDVEEDRLHAGGHSILSWARPFRCQHRIGNHRGSLLADCSEWERPGSADAESSIDHACRLRSIVP